MYKQIFNETSGRALNIGFDKNTTDWDIFIWVGSNLDELGLGLSESWSCITSFDADKRIIEIHGDEDLKHLRINNFNLIKL